MFDTVSILMNLCEIQRRGTDSVLCVRLVKGHLCHNENKELFVIMFADHAEYFF